MNRYLFWLTTLLAIGLVTPAFAQPKARNKPVEDPLPASVSIRLGASQLYGDLRFPRADLSAGMHLSLPFTHVIAAELLLDVGRLRAEQEVFYNSRAQTLFGQVALAGSINLLRLFSNEPQRSSLTVYGGMGLIFFDAKAYNLQTDKLQRFSNDELSYHSSNGVTTHGSQGVTFTRERAYPIGLRFMKPLGRQVSVFGDLRFTFVNTDKLDATVDGDNTAYAGVTGSGFIYGNPQGSQNKDKWGALSIGLTYFFGQQALH